jgi:hypothetical protein
MKIISIAKWTKAGKVFMLLRFVRNAACATGCPSAIAKKGGMEAMAHAPRMFQGSSTMVLKTSNIAIRTETGITSMLMRSAGSAANALLGMDPP